MFASKWKTYNLLKKDPSIRPHLPETYPLYQASALRYMLEKYGDAIIKPDRGAMGLRVLLVSALYISRSYSRNADFIIQRYIPLARVDGFPFDLTLRIKPKDWSRRIPSCRNGS